MKHMDMHWGEQFPCQSCDKLLASCQMLREHRKGCTQGSRFSCNQCDKDYATKQGLRQHTRAVHGLQRPAPNEVFLCHGGKTFKVKKSMREHVTTCSQNPDKKGPFFCHVEGCPSKDHPFSRIKNLNAHMSSCHRGKECTGSEERVWTGCLVTSLVKCVGSSPVAGCVTKMSVLYGI